MSFSNSVSRKPSMTNFTEGDKHIGFVHVVEIGSENSEDGEALMLVINDSGDGAV